MEKEQGGSVELFSGNKNMKSWTSYWRLENPSSDIMKFIMLLRPEVSTHMLYRQDAKWRTGTNWKNEGGDHDNRYKLTA